MSLGIVSTEGILVAAIVFAGGLVVGFAGFGYAVVSTASLAVVLPPADAVTVMIIPLLAANVSLARELDEERLRTCVRRFWPYVLAAILGTAVGMALLNAIPASVFALGLGLFTLGYVVANQRSILPTRIERRLDSTPMDTVPIQVVLGTISGFVFGASNVGVQVVAYLDTVDVDREVFVGVLALIFLGVSTVRVGLASVLGLYGPGSLLYLSIVVAGIGLIGVSIGARFRASTTPSTQNAVVSVLLTVIGFRLVLSGLGIV
ncbi:Sulfite exporter, TauE/SafE family [Halanaeroarchaeum sp. HSR-CO]|uniref:sulfite exporter TauE/SafE family protein n=1 Tax=Halanaeroarchaeum sp. HSR-CO TaxID=2866382 RepID=UPI00217E9326|nr:sulfite exporter TauE/SafE family protein [Halanaeroarchaeum sp. HSR-CO]UWG47867.1 Sulfite exporter, TauE/SafE family [Halanaeroarchaeum sp. HSR-CO]